jgi:hypothetical protein
MASIEVIPSFFQLLYPSSSPRQQIMPPAPASLRVAAVANYDERFHCSG